MKHLLYIWVLLLLGACVSRSQSLEEQFGSFDSLVVDYWSKDIDTTWWSEKLKPYEALGIKGKTLSEMIEKYGNPKREDVEANHNPWWGGLNPTVEPSWDYSIANNPFERIDFILQKVKIPIDIYMYYWEPFDNRDIVVSAYFIKYKGELRVIYGEQIDFGDPTIMID